MDNKTRRSLLMEQLAKAKELGYKTFVSIDEEWCYGYICSEKETMNIGVDTFGFIYLNTCHVPHQRHGSALSIISDIAPCQFNIKEAINKALLRWGWYSVAKQVRPLGLEQFKNSFRSTRVTEY